MGNSAMNAQRNAARPAQPSPIRRGSARTRAAASISEGNASSANTPVPQEAPFPNAGDELRNLEQKFEQIGKQFQHERLSLRFHYITAIRGCKHLQECYETNIFIDKLLQHWYN